PPPSPTVHRASVLNDSGSSRFNIHCTDCDQNVMLEILFEINTYKNACYGFKHRFDNDVEERDMSHTSNPGSDAEFGRGRRRARKNEEHTHLLSTATTAVSLSQVTKQFGDFTAVKDLNIDIRDGEFFSMLGPSGSGKTTVLRMIAGFENVTSGTIELHGENVTNHAPFDREVNTVFQDYALFPHLTIAENVAYCLKVRKVPRTERDRLVTEALEQ